MRSDLSMYEIGDELYLVETTVDPVMDIFDVTVTLVNAACHGRV